MDLTTTEFRKQQWAMIVSECHARPDDMTAKEWLQQHHISEKSYYYWQRKLRREAYELMQTESEQLSMGESSDGIAFAELPFPIPDAPIRSSRVPSNLTVAEIQLPKAQISISNSISNELMATILREVIHHA